MSTIESEDLEASGYFLPEDSQLRLKQLREYVEFLANLAQPRISDEAEEWFSEIRPGEVAICLELLEGQVAQVLEELSWPAKRIGGAAAGETEAEAVGTEAAKPDVTEPVMDEASNRHIFGVSLNQIDEINLLLENLRAHGNVVTTSDHAELTDATLSIMGDAIVRDAEKLRGIIDEVNAQQPGPERGQGAGVREEETTYLGLPALLRMPAVPIMKQHPTYQ